MISVGTTGGLRANIEQTPFDLRIKPRQSAKQSITGFELLRGYRCIFGLVMTQVIIFDIGFWFDFSLEVTLNLLFILFLAVHFALIVAFAIRNFRWIVVHEVSAHHLGWRGLVDGQEGRLVGIWVIDLIPVVEGLVLGKARLLVLKFVWVYRHLRKLLFLAKEDWVCLRRR